MKKLFVILFLIISGSAQGQIFGYFPESWTSHSSPMPLTCQGDRDIPQLTSVLVSTAKSAGVLGAQIMLRDGNKTIMSCGAGYNDPLARAKLSTGQEPIRMGFNTPQRLASITKWYVHVALRQLQVAGKVNFADNLLAASGVSSYDGIVRQSGFAGCTIEMALNYICQINVNFADPYDLERDTLWHRPFTLDQQMSYEVGRSLNVTPEVGGYSNVAYGLLGKVIERASGMSMIDYIRQYVGRPAGVPDTEIQIAVGAYQTCSDNKWVTVKSVQRCQNLGNTVSGREPGEVAYDSTEMFPSEYDKAQVLAADGGNIGNGGGAFGVVSTPRAVLRTLAYFDKDGYARNPNATSGFNLVGGIVTGSMVQGYREGKLSLFVGFNRSTREPGTLRPVSEVAMNAIFTIARGMDWSGYSDLDTDSSSRIQMRTYCHTGLNYCFLAGPLSASVLDNVPGWVRQNGVGDGFTAWAPGVKKNVYRYFHEGEATHFFGTYDDAKFVTRINPQLPLTQADGFIGFRYEAIEMSVVQPDISAQTCESGTVPVYRLFRAKSGSLSANHRYTTDLAFYNNAKAGGWAGEGVVFCAAQ